MGTKLCAKLFGEVKWNCPSGLWNCKGFGLWVRSNVTVGNGAEAESDAEHGEKGSTLFLANKFGLMIRPSALGIDPESSIDAAADVVDAIDMAAGGSGWLWLPS